MNIKGETIYMTDENENHKIIIDKLDEIITILKAKAKSNNNDYQGISFDQYKSKYPPV